MVVTLKDEIWRENVYLNQQLGKPFGFLDKKTEKEKTRDLLNELGIELDIHKKVSELSMVQQQMVEIIKAISVTSKVNGRKKARSL